MYKLCYLHFVLLAHIPDRLVGLLRLHVSPVQHRARHVLPFATLALHHLVVLLEAGVGQLADCGALVRHVLRGHDRRVRH